MLMLSSSLTNSRSDLKGLQRFDQYLISKVYKRLILPVCIEIHCRNNNNAINKHFIFSWLYSLYDVISYEMNPVPDSSKVDGGRKKNHSDFFFI